MVDEDVFVFWYGVYGDVVDVYEYECGVDCGEVGDEVVEDCWYFLWEFCVY